MIKRIASLFVFLCLTGISLQAQPVSTVPDPLPTSEYTGIQAFLSSDWMEGREAGARGGWMAADYIASMMQINGLLPCGNQAGFPAAKATQPSPGGYFQVFTLMRCQTGQSSLSIIRRPADGVNSTLLTQGIDYDLTILPHGVDVEGPVVWAGYGIEAPAEGYDEYHGLDVKNRIVVMLPGYPGWADTTAQAGKRFVKENGVDYSDLTMKLRSAWKHGAAAVVLLETDKTKELFSRHSANGEVTRQAMDADRQEEADYEDPEYFIPGDTSLVIIPCVILGLESARILLAGSGIDPIRFEKMVTRELKPGSANIPGIKLRLTADVKTEFVTVRNVLGWIKGVDTSRWIVTGAHYDHLGTRNGLIFNGADDNASGVAGMLTLSRKWANPAEKPPCNMLFAAWTAEEKGVLGSTWFSRHPTIPRDNLSLVVNMDMISRSAPGDSKANVISIGTLPVNEDLRDMARSGNAKLNTPFTLDLWDVTGHSGSDYGPFAAMGIPVMTFFSGFHSDYHTPGDIFSRTDPVKMGEILKLVDDCIRQAGLQPPVR